jgi:hypothetical protein
MRKKKYKPSPLPLVWFRFTVLHDGGTANLIIPASGLLSAIAQILTVEGCPLSAIVNIKCGHPN